MKDKALAFLCGFSAGVVSVYLCYRAKQGGASHKRKKSIRERPRGDSRGSVHERDDQIEALEACFFSGMDNILKLSEDKINGLKCYLHHSSTNGACFADVGNLKDILMRMKQSDLITTRSYGRISSILQNAGIDPNPIILHIGRLTDAVADLRDGFEPHDFQAGDYEFDGVIIHCEEDREEVVRFMNNAEDMLDVQNLSLCTMDEFNISKPKLEGLATVFSRARYVYVYASENLQDDDVTRFMSEMALTDSLTDPQKKYRFIPIWATATVLRIPTLQQFNGLKYHRCFKSQSEMESFCGTFKKHIRQGRNEIL